MGSPKETIRALERADQKILALLGIEVKERGAGRTALEMTVRSDMVNSQGVCHGGFLYTLADTALAYAAASDGVGTVTVSAQVIYTRPARLGDTVRAEARVVTRTRRTGTGDVEVADHSGECVARFRGVFSRREA